MPKSAVARKPRVAKPKKAPRALFNVKSLNERLRSLWPLYGLPGTPEQWPEHLRRRGFEPLPNEIMLLVLRIRSAGGVPACD